ncbi:MAG TPA: MFS transporter [Thermoanaerobaculia bacterium]|nr:MFS transporter [Thermoanaerobaculia bacterium]
MAPQSRKLQPQVILLGFVSLLNDSASEMIYPLLPVFITTTLGATPVIVGFIEGAADALASILKYGAGAWSDRARHRKPLIATGYALAAGSRALIGGAWSWVAVLTARLIDRSGKGIRSAPRDAMISDVTPPEQRGRAYGFHRAMDHTGAVAGPLLATLLLSGLGVPLRHMFYIAVIPGAIAVVLILVALKEPERGMESRLQPVAGPAKAAAPLGSPFWHVITAIALFSLANSSDAFLLLQAHTAGVSTAMLPLLWSAHHVVKSLLSTPAGALSDRVERRYLIAVGWLLYAVTYFFFPAARSVWSFFALFIFYALPFVFFEGAERALIADLVPAAARGKSFGIYYLVSGMGVLVGSVIFGELYEHYSHWAAFAVGAALAVVAAIAVLTLPRRAPAERAAS